VKTKLTVDFLCSEARRFAELESSHTDSSLYGVTDGQAVGTYLEHKFQRYLHEGFEYVEGSSAKGIDFPDLNVDMKVTSARQPQSSCPFKSARQKIYGLGYSLLVFVYNKVDDPGTQTGRLQIQHTVFVEENRTADYQTTHGIHELLARNANIDDLVAFMAERFLPVDEIQASDLAEEILSMPPPIGYLTISNALQWRLQYRRVIQEAGNVNGLRKVL